MTRFPYESSWGGEESHTLSLARYFREEGHEVIFMGSCPVLLKKFAEEGFEVHPCWGGGDDCHNIRTPQVFPALSFHIVESKKTL